MCTNLWKTVCSVMNIPFLLKFFLSRILLSFMESFKTAVAYKRKTYKTRTNSNLNADQSNCLAKLSCEASFRIICAKYRSDEFTPKIGKLFTPS